MSKSVRKYVRKQIKTANPTNKTKLNKDTKKTIRGFKVYDTNGNLIKQ